MKDYEQEKVFELLSRTIDTCRELHEDSRTPIKEALELAEILRGLREQKRLLRTKGFNQAEVGAEYLAATSAMHKVVTTIKSEVLAHQRTMEFVNDAAAALSAVIGLVTLVA